MSRDTLAPPMRSLLFAAFLSTSIASGASAQVGIRIEELAEDAVRVDGMLRDWRGMRRIRVGEGDDASLSFALGYDRRGLYFAGTVRDERTIRSARPSRDEDAVVLTLATPAGSGYRATEIWLYAGEAGRSSGVAATADLRGRPRVAAGADVVEQRSSAGYELEAFIPWRAIDGSERWQEGRLAVRLNDVDSEARPEVENAPATALVDARHLERLPQIQASGGESAALQAFLRAQGLSGVTPTHELRGDVCGDRRPERVAQVGSFIVVFGDGYRDGSGFDFLAMPVAASADIERVALQDLTGDGKSELVVEMRQRDERGSRGLWQLYTFDGASVRPLFGIETSKETRSGRVESSVRVRAVRRGAPTIEVRAGRADGLDASTLRETAASDAQAILVPWGPVAARTYQWDGARFHVVSERPNRSYRPPETTTSSSTTTTATAAPAPPGVRDLLAAVRRERRIPASVRPRFAQDANVAFDAQVEHIEILGDALVVVGPGFREGRGYFYYALPDQAGELLDVSTVDLTGDGRAEILIRGRQQVGDVARDVLMVHRFVRDGSFPLLLVAEVGRQQERRRIENEVRTSGSHLEIRPGRSNGWDAASWPWSDTAAEGQEPLLLPWRDAARRYRFVNGRLVR